MWRPADLAVTGLIPASIPACGENLSKRGRGPNGNCHSLSPSHRPDMTEIMLKRRNIASHLFIPPYLTPPPLPPPKHKASSKILIQTNTRFSKYMYKQLHAHVHMKLHN